MATDKIYIYELPFDLRTKFSFPLAMHSCVGQPTCWMLQPLIEELMKIQNDLLTFSVPIGDSWIEKKFTVKLLCGVIFNREILKL